MNVSRSKQFRAGFRLESWDLERLAHILGGDEMVTCISVEMADGTSYQLEHVAELKEIRNTSKRRITAVTMESSSTAFPVGNDHVVRIALVTIREGRSDTVRYHVSGTERKVDRLTRELDDWVASLSPWYSSLAVMNRVHFFLWTVAVVGTLALVSLVLHFALGSLAGISEAWPPGRLSSIATAVGLLSVALVGATLNLRQHRIFPAAEFRIGQNAEALKRSDRGRTRLLRASVGAAVVALGGSIAGVFLG
jgi:hypothetical protein